MKRNTWTIIAISAIAWIVLILSHEVIGHGGAATLNGGSLAYFDAMNARYIPPEGGFTYWQSKFNTAAGTLINLMMMAVATIWFTRMKNRASWLGFGLWIFVLFSAFQNGCYIAFSQFIYKSMDWHRFIMDLQPLWFYRVLVLVIGTSIIGFGCWFTHKYHVEFLDATGKRLRQKVSMLIIPWLTASLIGTAVAFLVPTEHRLVMVLGGMGNSMNFLIFMPILALIPSRVVPSDQAFQLENRVPIMLVGVLMLFLYLATGFGVEL